MTTSITTPTPLAARLRRDGFSGRIVEPGRDDYDRARACWNGDVDRRPAAVAFASGARDVAAAIRGARAAGVPLTVRGGGHSVSGRSVRDGALCIDLRGLRGVRVDPAARTVTVGGGALLGELDAATQRHGLAVPAGQVSHTGVGGLTLGGGLGWLMRRHGLTIDSLIAVDAVLADGSAVRASADEHPDLFWALRGGGGDFAVATRCTFRAHPVGPTLLAGMLVYRWEDARRALRASRDLMAQAHEELTIFDVLLTAPPDPAFPEDLRGRRVAVVGVAWCGDPAEGERVLAPLRSGCPPALDGVSVMPYLGLQTMLDASAPHGWRFHDRLHYLDAVSDDHLDALLAGFEEVPSPESHVVTGGHRDARAFTWFIACSGERPIDADREWVRGLWERTSRFATGGVYVNALDAGRPVRDAYAGAVWDRLVRVKRAYDPDGVFRGNGIG